MSLFTAEVKRRINSYFPSLGDRAPGMGTGGLLGLVESMLSSVANGKGASQVGVEDAATNFTGTDVEAVLAELYTAATTGGSDAITDTNAYYTTDTVDGGFDALGVQIGGDTDATFNFTEANVLTDDDALYAALEKLDLSWGDLASIANAEGAALVGVEDAAGYLTAANVEAALAEVRDILRMGTIEAVVLATDVAVVTGSFFSIDEESAAPDDLSTITGLAEGQVFVCVLADADNAITIKDAVDNIQCPGGFDVTLSSIGDFVWGVYWGASARIMGVHTTNLAASGLGKSLGSSANGQGASRVAIEDSAGLFAANDVEAALAEAGVNLNTALERYEQGVSANPALANGTTAGKLKTVNSVDFRVAGAFFTKGATDDLWDLSGEIDTDGASFRAYWLLLNAAGVATIDSSTDEVSGPAAIAALPPVAAATSVIGCFVAGLACDFNDAGGLAAQGTIFNGWPSTAF